jgi:[acyl-carrier-protein] S-malonyltransferase
VQDQKHAVFAFPGIGIELSMAEKGLYARHITVYEPYFEEGSRFAGCDLDRALSTDSIPLLAEREHQIFTYCFSAATFKLCRDHGWIPALFAGYSFGAYAAVYAAGGISFTDGMRILDCAFSLMTRCSAEFPAGMCAVIGLELSAILDLIRNHTLQSVEHINSNNEFCHIFCGSREEIEALNRLSLENEAINAILLDVTLPYHHSRFAQKAYSPFTAFCGTIAWHSTAIPVIATTDHRLLRGADELRDYVTLQLASPINWFRTIEHIHATAVPYCIECGPGISLTQNARFIPGTARWFNSKNMEHRL